MVAFLRGDNLFLNTHQIYVKILPDGQATQLTNDPQPKYGAVFTPDGSRVAYTSVSSVESSWDTWTVPVTGGAPVRFMRNAAGLSWIGTHQLLFSEIMSGSVLHMGIVTSEESRANERRIYFPDHERAMAHYSLLSPDRKMILVVEMDGSSSWLPCRLLPVDGSSKGRKVGPIGSCIAAAWSPDGKWMYFNTAEKGSFTHGPTTLSGATHIWRQKFPDGPLEQITFGPGEEEGMAINADGKSLISSVGVRTSSVWIHDTAGDHPVSQEGSATHPKVSPDGKRVYYLLQTRGSGSNGLWFMEWPSGKSNPILPGISMRDFDISRDGQQVAFTGLSQSREILVAPLDGSGPPRLVYRGGDSVAFGGPNQLVFRQLTPEANFVARIGADGTNLQRVFEDAVADLVGVSPDGNWIVVCGISRAKEFSKATYAISRRDRRRVKICTGLSLSKWSADGAYLYVTVKRDPTSAGLTLALPTRPDGMAVFPPDGILPDTDDPLPGAKGIRQGWMAPGPDPETYAFVRSEFIGNLYRIPLP